MEGRPVFPLKTKGSAGRRLLVYTVQVYLLAVQTIQGETSVMDVRAAVAIEAGKPLEVTTVQSEAQARASEERMRRFVADASHELRTPLTSIRGFAEPFRQGAAAEPEPRPRGLRRVEGEAVRMGRALGARRPNEQ